MREYTNIMFNNKTNKKTKKTEAIVLVSLISIFIFVAISLTIYGQLSNESVLNIFQTDFGEKYKTELDNMKGVSFYVKKDTELCMTELNVESKDSIDNNIILLHMICTHLNQILPGVNESKVRIIGHDDQGVFFDTTTVNLEFTKSFCREEYITAVAKKEKLLYNFPVKVQ